MVASRPEQSPMDRRSTSKIRGLIVGIRPWPRYTVVLDGFVAPPSLLMIMLIGNYRKIMKDKVNGSISNRSGWTTTVVTAVAAVTLLLSLGLWK